MEPTVLVVRGDLCVRALCRPGEAGGQGIRFAVYRRENKHDDGEVNEKEENNTKRWKKITAHAYTDTQRDRSYTST